MIGLPNEDCLLSRFEFLIGKGIKTHGLEMVGTNMVTNISGLYSLKRLKKF